MTAWQEAGTARDGPADGNDAPRTDVLVIAGQINPSDIPGLCDRARELLEGGAGDVVCDVGALSDPDLDTIDTLARLQLTVRRLGRQVRLRDACCELRDLLARAGLSDVLPVGLGRQPRRQTEQREQLGGVEERVHRDDPTG